MIRERFFLNGKRGIVTGASRGLGLGMAEGCVEMGAHVLLASRDMERLEEAAKRMSQYDGKAIPCRTDVAVDSDLEQLVGRARSDFGGIDFAILNAGIVRRGVSHEHSPDDFDEVYRVNVRSVFILAGLCAKVMIEQGTGGSIVITDSVVSVHGSRNVPGYAASKGAVHSMIHTLANDWGCYNIRVNGIGPGFCETDMTEGIRSVPERYDYLSGRMALGRWGRPDDFAGAAVFLVSDASAYITGTTLYVDGGFLSM